jgi:MscS family membrane protein
MDELLRLVEQAVRVMDEHPHVEALAIVVSALLAAYLVEFLTVRVLLGLASKTTTDLDDAIVEAIRRPLFASVVLAGAWLALGRLGPSETVLFVARGLLVTVAVLYWAGASMQVGKLILHRLAERADEFRFVETRTIPLFDIILKIVIIGGATYGMLLAWSVDVTAWLASAGILGIAIGFAAKDTLANLFSGIFILADAPYQIGDFVVLASGERGQVTDIGIRSTRLLTRDDVQIVVPNAAIGNAKIVNESGGPDLRERVRVKVGVAYGSDIDRVREVLLEIAEASSVVVADPEPRVRMRGFGDSSLDFELLGWIEEPVLRGRALDELYVSIYKRFEAENIKIPFPQRDVHLQGDQS